MHLHLVRVLLAAAGWAVFCAGAQADPSWPDLATTDLKAIHDLIQANHPGPVDPENPRFREWLDKGYAAALGEAKTAASRADFERALRLYTNGFQDGHVGLGMKASPAQISWTGFSVYGRTASDIRVVDAEPDAGVKVGDTLVSCDGKTIDKLLAERTDRYYWNAAVPHARTLQASRLFFVASDDTLAKLKSCKFSSGTVALKWRDEPASVVRTKPALGQQQSRAPSLRREAGLWIIRLPSFAANSDADVAAFNAVLDEIRAHHQEMLPATVVLDMRRNTGGSSLWGDKVVAALWGQSWVDRAHWAMDSTLDFRASADNLETLDKFIAAHSKPDDANSMAARQASVIRTALAEAIAKGQALVRFAGHPKPVGAAPPNPMTGKVYFLTDNACGSACLDFADIVRRIPGVTHIGLPTSADSVYMEVGTKALPSGLAALSYPMKVYRHRARGNNEFYTPQILWTGGPMSDDTAVTQWVKSLP